MRIPAMIMAMILALFALGCGEAEDSPAPAEGNGETADSEGDQINAPVEDDGEPAGPGSGTFEYTVPEVGQWIAWGVEGEDGEFKLSIVAEEDGCLWYQIEVDGEAVAQVLVDPEILDDLIVISGEYMDSFIADPVAFIEENMPENGQMMQNEEYVDNMITALEAIKKVKINDGTQIMLLDMTGVPEMVEQMLAENPDLLDQGFQMDAEADDDMEEFLAELEQAEFSAEEVTVDDLEAMRFTATHPEEGTLEAVIAPGLPIIPLMEARAIPGDPAEEGGAIMVTGYGYEGAENLMTGEPDQVIPVTMMLQGMASQFQNAGGMPQGAAPVPQ